MVVLKIVFYIMLRFKHKLILHTTWKLHELNVKFIRYYTILKKYDPKGLKICFIHTNSKAETYTM